METRARRRERQRMYNLDTMPQVAMEHILKYCDYRCIYALRKTCTHTRGLVDLIKPDLDINRLGCSFESDVITLSSSTSTMPRRNLHYENEHVWYKNTPDGCSVSIDEGASPGKFFKGTTAAEMFYQDFKILFPFLVHQKKPLDHWRLWLSGDDFAVFQSTIGRVFSEFNAQLRTESFILRSRDRPDLMTMIPLMCAETLTKLEIISGTRRRDEVLDLSQVAELAQWKSIRRLRLHGYLPDTLSRLRQFSDSYVSRVKVGPDDIVSLKEALRNAPLLNECTIYDYVTDRDEVRRAMFPRDSNGDTSYFSTTTPEFVFSVELATWTVHFKRIPRSSLKHNDIVIMD